MSDVIKGKIGMEDFQLQTNINAPEQFQRLTSVGGTQNLYKMPDIWNSTGRINVSRINVSTINATVLTTPTATITSATIVTADIMTANAVMANLTTAYITNNHIGGTTDPGDITEVIAGGGLTHDVLKTKINAILAQLRLAGIFG